MHWDKFGETNVSTKSFGHCISGHGLEIIKHGVRAKNGIQMVVPQSIYFGSIPLLNWVNSTWNMSRL